MMTDAEMVEGSPETDQLARLRAIMHRLRSPGGCPWDAEQTHESLVPSLIEETYEVVDTIQREDWQHLKEELGDLLLQVVFHSEIAGESGGFTFDDVARGISEKLVRRHPHVFGKTLGVDDPEAVARQWDEIKQSENNPAGEERPYLQGVGAGLPGLLRAAKLQKKAAKVGFDFPIETGVVMKIREELLELEAALDAHDGEGVAEETGDLLFSVVNLARFRHVDPELLMAAANQKFERRFGEMERVLRERGLTLEAATPGEMDEAWEAAKERLDDRAVTA